MGRIEHTLLDEGRASSPTDLRPSPATPPYHKKLQMLLYKTKGRDTPKDTPARWDQDRRRSEGPAGTVEGSSRDIKKTRPEALFPPSNASDQVLKRAHPTKDAERPQPNNPPLQV